MISKRCLACFIDYYLIVILDEKNMTFSVEPYDGEMFK